MEMGPWIILLGREGWEKGRDEQKPKCVVKSNYLLPPVTLKKKKKALKQTYKANTSTQKTEEKMVLKSIATSVIN